MRYPSYSVNAIGFVRSSLGDVGEAPNQASQGAPEALLEIDRRSLRRCTWSRRDET